MKNNLLPKTYLGIKNKLKLTFWNRTVLPIFFLLLINFLGCQEAPQIAPPEYYLFNLSVKGDIPTDKKIAATLQAILPDSTKNYSGKIERRGGFSIGFDKHSYELDLVKDVSLGTLPADDDWILNANYIDKTFMRHVFAYDLFRDMHPDNRAARTKYAKLYLNDIYQGLYVLMEKLDKSSLEIDGNSEAAVIFKEPPLFITGKFTPQNPKNYFQQKYPKKKKDDRTSYIAGVQNFIKNSEFKVFDSEISNFFDIKNIIDWHLLLLLTNNNDGILKNFYLYKANDTTALRIAPWDYDHSLGRDGDNELNLINRPLNIKRSILFRRLLMLDWYKKRLKNRWIALNESGLFTIAALQKRIDGYQTNLAPLIAENFEKWPLKSRFYYDENDFLMEVAIIQTYFELRHEQLSTYFDTLIE